MLLNPRVVRLLQLRRLFFIPLAALLVGCAGGGTSSGGNSSGSGSTGTQPAVSIASAGATTVDAGDTVTLNASVSNDPSNGGVIWTLSSNPMASSSTTTTSATFVPSVSNTSKLSYTVTATSKDFASVSNSITVTVNPLPAITSSGLIATATEGSSYSANLIESGGTGTATWTLAGGTSLPAGLTLNSNGTITGTPTGPAGTNFAFSVQAKDADTPTAHSSAVAQLSININNYPLPTFSVSTLPNGTIGQNYSQNVSIVGGHAPFKIVTEGVPGGIATTANGSGSNVTGTPIQASTVTFGGTPSELGNHFPITILVSDSSNPMQYNSSTYYVDVLPSGNPPAEIVADASQLGPLMGRNQLGANVNIGFTDNSNSTYRPYWSDAGIALFRYPGGLLSDYYHWQTHTYGPCSPFPNPPSATSFDNWMQSTVVPLGAGAAITVNYGTNATCTGPGDANEAAAWVNYANNTQHYGVKYWTVGNEQYFAGSVQPDLDMPPGNPVTYANRVASQFYPLMKAQDPTIYVGVDMEFGAVYSVPLDTWDQVVLSKAQYDFVEMHYYPERGNLDDDATLLTTWSNQVASNFATANAMLAAAGKPNTPIYLGEFERDSGGSAGSPGHESVSVVDGLFIANVIAEEVRAGVTLSTVWTGVDGCWLDSLSSPISTAYGWQNWGSWGLFGMSGSGFSESCVDKGAPVVTAFPKGVAFQILSQYVLAGEHVISIASTDSAIRGYAATNKGGYALLLVNTDENATHTLPVTISNASGSSYTETTLTYGKAQYDLSHSGTWAGAVSANLGTVGTSFNVSLPPWSITLVQLH